MFYIYLAKTDAASLFSHMQIVVFLVRKLKCKSKLGNSNEQPRDKSDGVRNPVNQGLQAGFTQLQSYNYSK